MKIGRPQKYNEKTKYVGLYIPRTLKETLVKKAKQNDMSLSEYIVRRLS